MASAIVAATILGGTFVRAEEPDGFAALRYAWATTAPLPGDEAALRIDLSAVERVEGAVLSFAAPPGLGVRTGEFSPLVRAGGFDLGALERGGSRFVWVTVRAPDSGGGIVAFRLRGILENGASFEEGFGVPVGRIGLEARLRDGALEFPSEAPPSAGP